MRKNTKKEITDMKGEEKKEKRFEEIKIKERIKRKDDRKKSRREDE